MSEYDDTDCKILDAAERMFARQGFHGTVVADVAREANVGKGTVYRRFGNKADLFAELVRDGTRRLIDRLEESVRRNEPFDVQLETIARVHFDFFEESREIVRIIVQEGLSNLGEWQDDVLELWKDYRVLIRQFFEEEADGTLSSDFNAEDCSRLFVNMLWGILRGSILFDEDDPRNRFGSILCQIFLRGVTPDAK